MMEKFDPIIRLVRDIYQEQDAFIPLHAPTFRGNEKKYLNECIESTFVSSVGKFVDIFEQEIACYTGANHAIVTVNGTNAIHVGLSLVGVVAHDEVITQALTFIATANAISYAHAIPVFVDVDKDTMGLSPNALQEFLQENTEMRDGDCYNTTTNRRIKACVPMHTFGHACRIEEIARVCKKYHIALVEDAAEAMGSRLNGKHLGLHGDIAAISFNGNKIMTTGGGGVLITNNKMLAAKAKHLTTQAKVPHAWEYAHDAIGYNYRMPNLNAALGLAQLENLETYISDKRQTAMAYQDYFKNSDIAFFAERKNEQCNYWLNAITLKNREERDAFLAYTNNNGVMTRPIWVLMNKLPMFAHSPIGNLENAEWLEERVVNLPSSVR